MTIKFCTAIQTARTKFK